MYTVHYITEDPEYTLFRSCGDTPFATREAAVRFSSAMAKLGFDEAPIYSRSVDLKTWEKDMQRVAERAQRNGFELEDMAEVMAAKSTGGMH